MQQEFWISKQRAKQVGSKLLPIVMGLGLLTLAIRTLGQQLLHHPLSEIWHSIATIPRGAVALAVLLTAVNYWILTGYDTLALRYVRHPLSYPRSALVGAIAYAISNNIGFTFLSGGAIRYRFYRRWGVSAGAIAQVILFCNLSFWMGFLSVGGCLFTLEPVTGQWEVLELYEHPERRKEQPLAKRSRTVRDWLKLRQISQANYGTLRASRANFGRAASSLQA